MTDPLGNGHRDRNANDSTNSEGGEGGQTSEGGERGQGNEGGEGGQSGEAGRSNERGEGRETGDGESREASERWHWPVVESEIEYDNAWYTGGYDLVEQPDGTRKRYYWAELPPAVVVVAVADGNLVMVEQYRPAIREHCLELPAGLVEDGESATTAGARELREETGFDPGGVSLLDSFWCATGLLRHRRHIVFAEGLSPVERNLDTNEFLDIRTVPVSDALDLAREPPANDATIEGILLAREAGLLAEK